MKLYHFSHKKYSCLKPMIGKNRHSGEDKRIVGKPVVWLTPNDSMKDDGKSYQYKYTLEIKESDENLILDESLFNSSIQNGDLLGESPGIKWYAYFKGINYIKIEEWINTDEKYRSL